MGSDVKISVATLVLFVVCLPVANAQRITDSSTVFRAQGPPLMVQGVGPDLAPGYPLPAPANLQPEVVDGTSPWSAFSPPSAPTPPGAAGSLGATIQAPSLGVPNGTYVDPYAQQPSWQNYAAPDPGQPYSAYQPVTPFGQDPFLNQQQVNPLGSPQGFTTQGANGPRPYRFGWQQRLTFQWLPDEAVTDSPATGKFGWFGLDYELQWTQQMPGWIFKTRPHFGFRAWDGPRVLSLPNDVYRFGYEIGMETPRTAGPYSFMLSATPSINSDLSGTVTRDAWNFDAKGAMFFQLDRYWQAVVGMQFWDRVNDRILPYGGLVYTDDFWNWQLTFPKAEVSLFLGSEYMWAKWLYIRGEYHVESYEVNARFGGVKRQTQVEIEDWRALIGLKMDTGYYDWFFEGGWVFGRDVNFNGATPDFGIGTGFIGQLGFRF